MSEENTNRFVALGSLRMDLLWCPSGEYQMGSSEDEDGDNEDAQLHSVTLTKGFWLGKYQVTQAEYATLANEADLEPFPSKYSGEKRPVERVNWVQAVKWCQALTRREREAKRLPEGYEYRLPTEAEWEYACRATTTTALNSGNLLTSSDGTCSNLDAVGWYDQNSGRETHDVGLKQPNRWGFYDMHGNVEEWCWDWYGAYPLEAVVDPLGPASGKYRVCRGGNMGGMAMGCSSSARKSGNTINKRCYRGFRLALGPELGVGYDAASVQMTRNAAPQQQEGHLSMEELMQQRAELEGRLNVCRTYEEAIGGDAAIQGSRNFTVDEPSLRMIWCPSGTFSMGSPASEPGRSADEVQHDVTLSQGFWISMYEVTQADYAPIAECAGLRARPSNFAGLRRPVESVSYADVMRWCRELTYLEFISGRLPEGYVYRLPTEAEWEYACRAGTLSIFNSEGGDDRNGLHVESKGESDGEMKNENARERFEKLFWYKYNSGYKTHVVGERKPNAWGMCDMHGNVHEWCLDWYGDYPHAAASDPHGPLEGTERVIRGGCYGDFSRFCRSAHRGTSDPAACKSNIGFRVVLAPDLHYSGM